METLININVIIADRPYPLKVKAEEEEIVRKAAKKINDQMKGFQSQYAAKDKQDYLAMTVLTYAVNSLKQENKIVINDDAFSSKLNSLETLLSETLSD